MENPKPQVLTATCDPVRAPLHVVEPGYMGWLRGVLGLG